MDYLVNHSTLETPTFEEWDLEAPPLVLGYTELFSVFHSVLLPSLFTLRYADIFNIALIIAESFFSTIISAYFVKAQKTHQKQWLIYDILYCNFLYFNLF